MGFKTLSKKKPKMKKPSSIKTDRLMLRQWQKEDLTPLAKLNADPQVMEFLLAPLTREESAARLEVYHKHIQEHGWGLWAVSAFGVSDFIGWIGLWPIGLDAHFTPAIEVGWRLFPEFWGQGYATEGAKASLRYGFERLKLKEIVSITVPANLRSRRVMERIGMHHNSRDDFDHPKLPEGHPLKHHVLYRLEASEWKKQMSNLNVAIDASLIRRLIASQFPQWKNLPIEPVAMSGWDNRTFHLGKDMSVRLPSAADYELQIEKEHQWLPKLAPNLPLPIPVPLAMGKPEHGYPWKWSIYRWLEGKNANSAPIGDLTIFATDLANFLMALHRIDPTGGPKPGLHSFHRGGSLSVYDADTRRSIASLEDKIDTSSATAVWDAALSTSWENPPVWVHGDISEGNLLVKADKLCAVIDFGQLAIGDPACDLAINWTLFHGKSREIFQKMLSLDSGTWARARGWALWKALIVAAGFTNPNNAESSRCWHIIDEVLADHDHKI